MKWGEYFLLWNIAPDTNYSIVTKVNSKNQVSPNTVKSLCIPVKLLPEQITHPVNCNSECPVLSSESSDF